MASLAFRMGRIRSYREMGRRNSLDQLLPPRSRCQHLQHRLILLPVKHRYRQVTQQLSKGMRRKATLASGSLGNHVLKQRITFSRQLYQNSKESLAEILSKSRTLPIPRWITPKHYQFTASECFGHLSFVLVAISYAVDDFLLLRVIAVAGSTSMLFFAYFHPHGRILWLPFKWNILFIGINSYRIGMVYWKRYLAEQLSDELMELRKRSFFLMDPVDYYRLVRIAEIKEYKKGDLVVAQGENARNVRLVLAGQLRVLRDGKLTYMLEKANFLSEAGIHAGLMLPGNIESCCAIVADGGDPSGSDDVTRILCWDRSELVRLMELHEGVRRSLKAILSWDIVCKLKSQRSLLAENIIDDPEEWTLRRNEQTNHRYAAILHAILLRPNDHLKRFRKEINNYRMIHHIDDEHHAMALAECGWTMAEFEAGKKERRRMKARTPTLYDDDDEDDDSYEEEHHRRDWQWMVNDLYLRLFG